MVERSFFDGEGTSIEEISDDFADKIGSAADKASNPSSSDGPEPGMEPAQLVSSEEKTFGDVAVELSSYDDGSRSARITIDSKNTALLDVDSEKEYSFLLFFDGENLPREALCYMTAFMLLMDNTGTMTVFSGEDVEFVTVSDGEPTGFAGEILEKYQEINFDPGIISENYNTILAVDAGLAYLTGDSYESVFDKAKSAGAEDSQTSAEPSQPAEESPAREQPAEESAAREASSPSGSPTLGKQNALGSAKTYLRAMPFSYEGLIDQLEYEGYSFSEARYAADNCGADWNAQAVEKAKNYLRVSAFSYEGMVDQLEYEKFTPDEAVYGAENCGADWEEQAAKKAETYLSLMDFSRDELIGQLEFEGFTHEEAVYGAEANGY